MSSKPLKMLSCGDVKGEIGTLLKRIEMVNKKSGPFEMVLCAGQFFNTSTDGVDDPNLWKQILSDKVTLPVPLYILGPINDAQKSLFPNLDGCEFGSSICYLGRNGIFTTKEGLKIAYVSGTDDAGGKGSDINLDYDRVRSMEVKAKCHESNFQGVDILLTTDWPKGVLTFCPPLEGITSDTGSPLLARLAVSLRPRYHFAGFRQVHFERLPYRNHLVISESTRHVTRFISLAEVGNKDKKKWLYAFNIVPMSSMERSELVSQPPNVTEMPFKESHMKVAGGDGSQNQFFYDMNAPMEDNNKKRRHNNEGGGGDFRQKRQPPKPTGPCWFCLSGAEVEKHLVVSIGEHSYLALPKGGLTDYHVMILPIAHHPSSLELPDEVSSEIERFKSSLKKCFKKTFGYEIVFFERNYKSQHLQLQAVPIPKEVANEVKIVFEDMGESMELQMTAVPDHANLAQMAQPGTPYFYAELPNNVKLFHRVRRGFPIQFGREVLASSEILNISDRIDWRSCQQSKEEETKAALDFRKMFEKFDFTLE